jgi:hypothetical protein
MLAIIGGAPQRFAPYLEGREPLLDECGGNPLGLVLFGRRGHDLDVIIHKY